MRLRALNKKLYLFDCSYHDRDFPAALKGYWDKKMRAWKFEPSIVQYEAILKAAKEQGIDLRVDDYVKDYFASKIKVVDLSLKTGETKRPPYPYQEPMKAFAMQLEKCFLFGSVGVGKTKPTVDVVTLRHQAGQVNKALIVVPASVLDNWAHEVEQDSFYEWVIIRGSKNRQAEIIESSTALFQIISYQLMVKHWELLIEAKYDMIVFDEIHYCKTVVTRKSGSDQAKYAEKLARHIRYRLGLTGTIHANNHVDMFQPFRIIDSTILGQYIGPFRERYCVMGGFMNKKVMGYKNLDELMRLVSSVSLRVNLRDVKDLPPELIIEKRVTLKDESMERYRRLEKELLIRVSPDLQERGVQNILEKMLRLQQVASGMALDTLEQLHDVSDEKLQALEELIEQIDGKVAVFANFTRSIDRITEMCVRRGWTHMVYDGRNSDGTAPIRYNEGQAKVWIAHLKKGIGYSIPSAKYAIFYEMNYSRIDHVQCKGRILRASGSEEGSCYYIYLMAAQTIDEGIYEVLKEKDFNAEAAMAYIRGVKR